MSDCIDEITESWKQHQAGATDRPYLDASGITLRAQEVYTEGDCWVLAWILLLDYRLPVVFVSGDYGTEDAHHVAIQLPSGDILDVRGLQTRQDFCVAWECGLEDLVEVGEREIDFLMALTEAVDPQLVPYELLERTREVADHLMSQSDVQTAMTCSA